MTPLGHCGRSAVPVLHENQALCMVAALVGLELHATRAEFHAALRSCAPILRERLGVILNQRDPGDLKAFEHSIDALLSAASPVDDPDWCRWAKLFADEKAAVALFGF